MFKFTFTNSVGKGTVTCITGDGPSNLVDQLQEQVTLHVAERLYDELVGTGEVCFNHSPAAIIINAGVEAIVLEYCRRPYFY